MLRNAPSTITNKIITVPPFAKFDKSIEPTCSNPNASTKKAIANAPNGESFPIICILITFRFLPFS